MYATEIQADAESIVRILQDIAPEMRENPIGEEECILCFNPLTDHSESCPFRMADEFIAKYGSNPPAGNWKRV